MGKRFSAVAVKRPWDSQLNVSVFSSRITQKDAASPLLN